MESPYDDNYSQDREARWMKLLRCDKHDIRVVPAAPEVYSDLERLAHAHACRIEEVLFAVLQHATARYGGVEVPEQVSMEISSRKHHVMISLQSFDTFKEILQSVREETGKLTEELFCNTSSELNILFSLIPQASITPPIHDDDNDDSACILDPTSDGHFQPTSVNFTNPYQIFVAIRMTENDKKEINFCSKRSPNTPILDRFPSHFETLLQGVVCNSPDTNLFTLPVVPLDDFQALDRVVNSTTENLGEDQTLLHHMFENRIKTRPNAVAVKCRSQETTYKNLNEKAEKISSSLNHLLKESSSNIVGICIPPSTDMIASAIAVLKSGNAYLPLDPSYPEDRLKYMTENARCKLVLVTRSTPKSCLAAFTEILTIDEPENQFKLAEKEKTNACPVSHQTENELAYVIYTSGSTGKPKGVMISHKNATNTIRAINKQFNITEQDSVLLVASLGFDLSVYDIFGVLGSGGKLIIPSVSVMGKPDPEEWLRLMVKDQVTLWNSAPAVMNLFVDYAECENECLPLSLRLVFLSGDKIPLQLPIKLQDSIPTVQVISLGGATEASIWSIFYPVNTVNKSWNSIPYGKPLPNQMFYVLDRNMLPVPFGVTGELYIGGVGVAIGYLNKKKLTEERFLKNPFAPGRIYKTGDLGRYLPDGNIEFCGRIDNQVKVRGFRVELGEIESAVQSCEGIKDSVVLKQEGKLIAYVITESKKLSPQDIKRFVSSKLPEYMIPSDFVFMDNFPVTGNGKIDYKMLSTLHETKGSFACNRLPNSTRICNSKEKNANEELAEKLISIWSRVLRIDSSQITIQTSFFQLGGDSISAMNVMSAARNEGLHLTIQDIFKYQSIENMCKNATLTDHRGDAFTVSTVEGDVPISPIQTWFFEQGFSNKNFWNQSFLLEIKERLDITVLKTSLQQVINHHDILRARFHMVEDKWVQIMSSSDFHFHLNSVKVVTREEMLQQISILQRQLNISQGPLLIFCLFEDHSSQQWLFITCHHLIIDLVSWHILLNDLELAYLGKALPMKTTSFQRWTQNLYINLELSELPLKDEEKSVKIKFETKPSKEMQKSPSKDCVEFSLTPVTTEKLMKMSNILHLSGMSSILLSTLVEAYNVCTGHRAVTVDVEGHGRDSFIEGLDVSHTIGWFTVIFPITLKASNNRDLLESLRKTHQRLYQCQGNGVKTMTLNYKQKLASEGNENVSTADVLFNYFGHFEQIENNSSLWKSDDSYPNGEDVWEDGEKMTHKLVIDCFLQHGELVVRLLFNSAVCPKSEITKLSNEWNAALYELTATEKFDVFSSHSALAKTIKIQGISQEVMQEIVKSSQMEQRDIEDIYLCSPLQTGLIYSLLQNKTKYLIQRIDGIDGPLDVNRFQQCIKHMVAKHAVLRTHFVINKSTGFVQVVRKSYSPPFKTANWSGSNRTIEQLQKEYLAKDRTVGFNIFQPLVRFALFSESQTRHTFVFTFHHAILDGWSLNLFMKDLYDCYHDEVKSKGGKFVDFIKHIYKMKLNDDSLAFWKDQLMGFDNYNLLSIQEMKGHIEDQCSVKINLPQTSINSLKIWCGESGVTTSAFICGAWATLLAKYSERNDIMFGLTVSGRMGTTVEGIDTVIGMCASTIPLRVTIKSTNSSFAEIVQEIQQKLVSVIPHEHVSLTDIHQHCNLNQRGIPFQTIITFEKFESKVTQQRKSKHDIAVQTIDEREFTEYPISVIFGTSGLNVSAKVMFDQSVFASDTIYQMMDHLDHIISAIINSEGNITLENLKLLSKFEIKRTNTFSEDNANAEKCSRSDTMKEDSSPSEIQAVIYSKQELEYWRNKLKYLPPIVNLPLDRPRTKCSGQNVLSFVQFQIPKQDVSNLCSVSEEYGCDLFTALVSVYSLLLYQYSRASDVVIGTTFTGQQRGTTSVVERNLTNMVPLHIPGHCYERSFVNVMTEVKRIVTEAAKHQDVPFQKIIETLELPKDSTFHPILQNVILLHDDISEKEITHDPHLSLQDTGDTTASLDLVLEFHKKDVTLEGKCTFNASILDFSTVNCLIEQLQHIITVSNDRPSKPFGELPMLCENQLNCLMSSFQAVKTPEKGKCVNELFEEQVALLSSEHIAVRTESSAYTYSTLNSSANVVAARLRQLGIKPNMPVGVVIDRSFEMLVGFVGVLKSGGTYVPIDASWPERRIQSILEDCSATVILTKSKYRDKISLCVEDHEVVHLDEFIYHSDLHSLDINLENVTSVNDKAYIIYTSGTTGKPKGVQVTHRGLSNLVQYRPGGILEVSKSSRVLQFYSISFDGCAFEIFTTLCNGGTLVLWSDDLEGAMKNVDIMCATPSLLSLMDPSKFPNLKRIMSGGEACSRGIVSSWGDTVELLNAYGPTEITVASHFGRVDPCCQEITVGKPLANTECFIIDEASRLVPIGVVGELAIGGVGVSPGYLNRPDLTRRKFVENPFGKGFLYRTGDYAKWTQGGEIIILGRMDNQVKVRGYRIEKEEIENTAVSHMLVDNAVVAVQDNNINLFLTPEQSSTHFADISAHMKRILPFYMMPDKIQSMKSFPLTGNGKVDLSSLVKNQKSLKEIEKKEKCKEDSSYSLENSILCAYKEVLDTSSMKISDNFFNLGGNSLLAIKLKGAILHYASLNVGISDIISFPCPEDLCKHLQYSEKEEAERKADLSKEETMLSQYPASYFQEQMCIMNELQGEKSLYIVPLVLKFKGTLCKGALQKAVQIFVNVNSATRTHFATVDGSYQQVITPSEEFGFSYHVTQMNNCKQENVQEKVQLIIENERFDLHQGPLIKFHLLEGDSQEHWLVCCMHHSIADGHSVRIMMEQICERYHASQQQKDHKPISSPKQYFEFSEWQRSLLTESYLAQEKDYWKNVLDGAPPILDLPLDRARPQTPSYKGSSHYFQFAKDEVMSLQRIAVENNCTLFMTLLGLYYVLMNQYTKSDDITIGTVFTSRHYHELDGVFGSLVNMIPLRMRGFSAGNSFRSLITSVKTIVTDAMRHQDIPFQKIVEALELSRDTSFHPVFQTAVFLQEGIPDMQISDELQVSVQDVQHSTATFDLVLEICKKSDTILEGRFIYNTDIFDLSTIEYMREQFQHILKVSIQNSSTSIDDLPLLCENQLNHLMTLFQADKKPERGKCVHELFEEQVSLVSSHHTAVTAGSESFTYKELNSTANALAFHLRKIGARPNMVVGVVINRSYEMIVALLAVLKSGAAYVPIDSSWPKSRIEFILQECSASILLTTEKINEEVTLSSAGLDIIFLEDFLFSRSASSQTKNLENVTRVEDLVYIIFTSGTTGKPKGVKITHRGLGNIIQYKPGGPLGASQRKRVLQFYSIGFDGCAFEIFTTLCNGGTLVLCSDDITSAMKSVDIACVTQSVLSVLDPSSFPNLKTVLCAGEALTRGVVSLWGKTVELINGYGPTEATVGSHFGIVDPSRYEITTGKPVTNTMCYIVNDSLKLLPIGVSGELFIGGVGVGKGYLNQPEKTKENFIKNPFGKDRVYKTGDYAKWTKDGEIVILGRKDTQVKVRGFRIEKEEIENAARSYEYVKDALVVIQEKAIILFVTPELPQKCLHEVMLHITQIVPTFMIPNTIHSRQSFPLTANGKIDTLTLLESTRKPGHLLTNQELSTFSEKEIVLATIWAKILNMKMEEISKKDSFFSLGGDSVSAIRVVSMAEKAGFKITLKSVLTSRSLHELSTRITTADIRKTLKENWQPQSSDVPLTPIQQWFFNQNNINKNHFNQCVILELKEKIDINRLKGAFKELMRVHAMLRCCYEITDESVCQNIKPESDISMNFNLIQTEAYNKEEFLKEIDILQKSLNIFNGTLLAVGVYQYGQNQEMVITIHHLVVDLVSWRTILEDLESLYKNGSCPPEKTSFQEWSVRMRDDFMYADKLKSWKPCEGALRGNIFVDRHVENMPTLASRQFVLAALPKNTTSSFVSKTNNRTTINDLLLTALIWSYKMTTSRDTLNVDLESHGRKPWTDNIDLSHTVGWFTSMYPVTLTSRSRDILETLRDVKQAVRNRKNNALDYGILKYIKKDASLKNNISDVVFNFHGSSTQFENAFELWKMGDLRLLELSCVSKNEKLTHKLCVESGINRGKLELNFIFSTEIHERNTVECWANECINALEHLSKLPQEELNIIVPVDFPLLDIHSDTLAKFQREQLGPKGLSQDNIRDIYPCSPLQQGLLSSLVMDKTSYLVQSMFTIQGNLDVDMFQEVWNDVIQRHDALRTNFVMEEERGILLQVVQCECNPRWHIEDWGHLRNNGTLRRIAECQYAEKDRQRGFCMNEPMMRFAIFKLSSECHWFVWTLHHALLDGWSISVVLSDVMDLYNGKMLSPAPQFKQHIRHLHDQDSVSAFDFWKKQLHNITPTLMFPHNAVSTSYGHGKSMYRTLSTSLQNVHRFARRHNLTISNLFFAAWSVVIKQITQTEEDSITFGIILSCRDAGIPNIESMAGMLINTLPMRVQYPNHGDISVVEWLQQIQDQQISVMSHSHCTLNNVHRWSGLSFTKKLFDTIIVFENYPSYLGDNAEDTQIKFCNMDGYEHTEYGIAVAAAEEDDVFKVKVMYNAKLISDESVGEITRLIDNVLTKMTSEDSNPMLSSVYQPSSNTCLPRNFKEQHRASRRHHSVNTKNSHKQQQSVRPQKQLIKEEILTKIWSKLLNMPTSSIRRTDSFFDLGGTSVQAVHMVSLARQDKLHFKLQQVWRCSTLGELARDAVCALGEATEGRKVSGNYETHEEPIVCLNEAENEETIVFLVHGGDGGISPFGHLVQALSSHTVYAFQYVDNKTPTDSVHSVATFYNNQIKNLLQYVNYSDSKFVIAGYSAGAAIAYEMALQLQKEKISHALLLLDSSPSSIREAYSDFQRMSDEQLSDTVLQQKQIWQDQGMDISHFGNIAKAFHAMLPMLTSYKPTDETFYKQNITLIRPEVRLNTGPFAQPIFYQTDYGLQDLCVSRVSVRWVAGNHYTMMRESALEIADIIVKLPIK